MDHEAATPRLLYPLIPTTTGIPSRVITNAHKIGHATRQSDNHSRTSNNNNFSKASACVSSVESFINFKNLPPRNLKCYLQTIQGWKTRFPCCRSSITARSASISSSYCRLQIGHRPRRRTASTHTSPSQMHWCPQGRQVWVVGLSRQTAHSDITAVVG